MNQQEKRQAKRIERLAEEIKGKMDDVLGELSEGAGYPEISGRQFWSEIANDLKNAEYEILLMVDYVRNIHEELPS